MVGDPNEAYEVINTPERLRGAPADWWTVTCNGIPVMHFGPDKHDLAVRYATDPGYREERRGKRKLWHASVGD